MSDKFIDEFLSTLKDTEEHNNVDSPQHYQLPSGAETISTIYDLLGHDGFNAYCVGNIVKYISRHKLKNGAEDIKKAKKYCEFILEYYYR